MSCFRSTRSVKADGGESLIAFDERTTLVAQACRTHIVRARSSFCRLLLFPTMVRMTRLDVVVDETAEGESTFLRSAGSPAMDLYAVAVRLGCIRTRVFSRAFSAVGSSIPIGHAMPSSSF